MASLQAVQDMLNHLNDPSGETPASKTAVEMVTEIQRKLNVAGYTNAIQPCTCALVLELTKEIEEEE